MTGIDLEPTAEGYTRMRQMFMEQILTHVPPRKQKTVQSLLDGVVEATKGVIYQTQKESKA